MDNEQIKEAFVREVKLDFSEDESYKHILMHIFIAELDASYVTTYLRVARGCLDNFAKKYHINLKKENLGASILDCKPFNSGDPEYPEAYDNGFTKVIKICSKEKYPYHFKVLRFQPYIVGEREDNLVLRVGKDVWIKWP
jgi:hypothetical protein